LLSYEHAANGKVISLTRQAMLNKNIHSDEGLALEMSASLSLHGENFNLFDT